MQKLSIGIQLLILVLGGITLLAFVIPELFIVPLGAMFIYLLWIEEREGLGCSDRHSARHSKYQD